jgi:hypothetical protein
MGRRRNNDTRYQICVRTPEGDTKQYIYDNLNDMACGLNRNFFSGFGIVTDTMISNWIHYPQKSRRQFAQAFDITKLTECF